MTLGLSQKEVRSDSHRPIYRFFTAAFFTIAKRRKNSIIHHEMMGQRHEHTMGYNSAITMDDILMDATLQNLANIVLSEIC